MYQSDCIFIYDDIFTPDECEYLVDVIQKYAVIDREVYEYATNVLADSIKASELPDPDVKKRVYNLIYEKILNICITFYKEYKIPMSGFSIPIMRKIKGATRQHKDGVVFPGQVNPNGYCDASELRNMSIIIALNDDYEGGELCFPEQMRTIKLKRGQVVAFPPYWTHPHYTNDLGNGTVRYTLNCWTYDKVGA